MNFTNILTARVIYGIVICYVPSKHWTITGIILLDTDHLFHALRALCMAHLADFKDQTQRNDNPLEGKSL